MDINISCRNCISENWDEYLEFFVSIIVWAIAQVNVIEFIFIIFRNEKIIPWFIVRDRGFVLWWCDGGFYLYATTVGLVHLALTTEKPFG